MTRSPPLVSVLIAAYNAEPWLAAALDSVLAQTHRPLQVIVVDDGSIDGTLAVAERYRRLQPGLLQVDTQAHAGACAARNKALAMASGSYLQFLDADDIIHPDKIQRQLQRLVKEDDRTVASGPWVRFTGAEPRPLTDAPDGPDWRDYAPATDWLFQSWSGRGMFPPHAWLVPRACVASAGPWREGLLMNQDGEYFARVLVEASRIVFVHGAWAYYRSGLPGSVSRQASEPALRSLFEAQSMCERTLLARVNNEDARRACAGLWQQFLFTAYPRVPDLCRRAEKRIQELGGMYRVPGVIRPLRPVRSVLGWKTALWLQYIYRRLRRT